LSFEDVRRLEEWRNVKGLTRILRSNAYPNVKVAAISALGRIGETSAIEPLIEALDSGDLNPSNAAPYALASIGKPAVPSSIQALKSPNSMIRRGAVKALGMIGDKRAVIPLIQALDDESVPVKNFAATALGNFPDDARVMEALIQELGRGARYLAAESLGKIGNKQAVPHLIQILKSRRGGQTKFAAQFRVKVIRALGMLGGPEVAKPLIEMLPNAGKEIQWEIGKALGQVGPIILDQILALLKSKQWKRRLAGVRALNYMEELVSIADDRVLDALLIVIWDPNVRIENEALYTLTRLKGPKLVQPLIQFILDKEQGKYKEIAAKILGELGDCQAVEPLISLLQISNWEYQKAAAEALGKLGDARAIPELLKILHNRFLPYGPLVRPEVANALRALGFTVKAGASGFYSVEENPDAKTS